ncbi:HesB/YadR/YfhF family protein [Neobacillus jeddahensis]|uniref:HesB/YadR/YfhF family protein n=1 Tax=Neobacillus jeddahensis TaxID=1461580 RepID=UPI0005916910|nr:HesB/YadR/YfhF family protein [Neobacillus jeddahensis]
MNIQITSEAAAWYREELSLTNGDFLRFFVRYGGCSTVQSGFSLGIAQEEPVDIGVKTVQNEITFYIEEKDLWYFDDHDLIIEYQSDYDEPVFQYKQMD